MKKKTKLSDKIAFSLYKADIIKALKSYFSVHKGMLQSWINAGKNETFEEFINKAMDEFEKDSNGVVQRMFNIT